ncbi:hypothetical protein O3P69_004923 [Scylla paramamosain]|uniref:Uncharacterized protein n=1 Tax=Scylla paramamosain TaxID=85552 RepID=A0AAW0UH23_SCYPA
MWTCHDGPVNWYLCDATCAHLALHITTWPAMGCNYLRGGCDTTWPPLATVSSSRARRCEAVSGAARAEAAVSVSTLGRPSQRPLLFFLSYFGVPWWLAAPPALHALPPPCQPRGKAEQVLRRAECGWQGLTSAAAADGADATPTVSLSKFKQVRAPHSCHLTLSRATCCPLTPHASSSPLTCTPQTPLLSLNAPGMPRTAALDMCCDPVEISEATPGSHHQYHTRSHGVTPPPISYHTTAGDIGSQWHQSAQYSTILGHEVTAMECQESNHVACNEARRMTARGEAGRGVRVRAAGGVGVEGGGVGGVAGAGGPRCGRHVAAAALFLPGVNAWRRGWLLAPWGGGRGQRGTRARLGQSKAILAPPRGRLQAKLGGQGALLLQSPLGSLQGRPSLALSVSLVGLRATHTNRHHGRHQEEDAGDEAGEGQRYGQGRYPGAAEQGGQPQGGKGEEACPAAALVSLPHPAARSGHSAAPWLGLAGFGVTLGHFGSPRVAPYRGDSRLGQPHCTPPAASRAGQSLPCPAALFTVHRVHSNGRNTPPPTPARQASPTPPRPHAPQALTQLWRVLGKPGRAPPALPALPAPRRAGGERPAPGTRRQPGAPGRRGSVPSRSGAGVAHSLTPRGGTRLPGNPRAPVTRPLL